MGKSWRGLYRAFCENIRGAENDYAGERVGKWAGVKNREGMAGRYEQAKEKGQEQGQERGKTGGERAGKKGKGEEGEKRRGGRRKEGKKVINIYI